MRTYGIRHHGPTSAHRLLAALEAYQPTHLLVELPADAGHLEDLINKGLRPPVALVLYDAKSIERASFYPFATFSPEYQAIRWAVENGVPVTPIDLPARFYLAGQDEATPPTLFQTKEPPPEAPSILPGKTQRELNRQLRQDPLSLIAELDGYPDSESWWDATLEREDASPETTFLALSEMVGELRGTFPQASNDENERREAYMRTEIRKAQKAGGERIAVVVGAFHAPAVANPTHYKVSTDKARLKGLPKVKVASAWVPWSYPRLARSGGYGAGVLSPSWYKLRFDFPAAATARWMATAGKLLRGEGYDASPAVATEAVGLANTLATLRGHASPGIEELEQALLGTLAAGRPERLAVIHEKLTVGTTVGFVPPGVTSVPLVDNLNKELKSTRMAKLWETAGEHYLKATKANPRGGIDLRAPNDLRKSHLLHRLNLLEIHWGRPQPLGPDTLSSFKEVWLLEWQPEFSLLLIERASYGNTVAAAAGKFALDRATEIKTAQPLAQLTLDCLRADLPDVVPELMDLLRARAAETTDVAALLETLPTLVQTTRYGDSRKTDTTALLQVIDELLPRAVAGLPAAATNIDDELAQALLQRIAASNYAIAQLDNEEHDDVWQSGLRRTVAIGGTHPLVEGHCVRLLYDHELLDDAAAATRFSRALSAGNDAHHIAQWLSGFLHGSGQLLFHYPPLWSLVDGWLRGLAWEDFEPILPLLRRTFADFSVYDRRRLLALAKTGDEAADVGRPPSGPTALRGADTETGEQPVTGNTAGRTDTSAPEEEGPHEDLVEALLNWMG